MKTAPGVSGKQIEIVVRIKMSDQNTMDGSVKALSTRWKMHKSKMGQSNDGGSWWQNAHMDTNPMNTSVCRSRLVIDKSFGFGPKMPKLRCECSSGVRRGEYVLVGDHVAAEGEECDCAVANGRRTSRLNLGIMFNSTWLLLHKPSAQKGVSFNILVLHQNVEGARYTQWQDLCSLLQI